MKRSLWFAVLAFVFFAASDRLRGADEQTWVGIISDGVCREDHGGEVDPKECTLKCVASGDKFVLMIDGYTKAMPIVNQDFPDLKVRAGETVKATGELKDGAILITRLEAR